MQPSRAFMKQICHLRRRHKLKHKSDRPLSGRPRSKISVGIADAFEVHFSAIFEVGGNNSVPLFAQWSLPQDRGLDLCVPFAVAKGAACREMPRPPL